MWIRTRGVQFVSWEAISAIADVLGAAGVISTVIYLAIQIRQNTRSVQGATEQTLMSQEIDVYSLTAQHAGIYRRGCENLAGLSSDDRVVFDHIMLAQMSQFYSGYVQFKRGLIPQQVWQAYRRSASWTLDDSGFMESWEALKHTYPEDFQGVVTGLAARGDIS
jgi:hypothetical protein